MSTDNRMMELEIWSYYRFALLLLTICQPVMFAWSRYTFFGWFKQHWLVFTTYGHFTISFLLWFHKLRFSFLKGCESNCYWHDTFHFVKNAKFVFSLNGCEQLATFNLFNFKIEIELIWAIWNLIFCCWHLNVGILSVIDS